MLSVDINCEELPLSFHKTLPGFFRRRQWNPTPVLLPGKSHGRRSLVGCSPWGHESDMTERLHFHFSLSCIGEGNGNPLQCSCLENPRVGGAWWAAVYGVAQSQTRLKRLSSSSSRLLQLSNFQTRSFFQALISGKSSTILSLLQALNTGPCLSFMSYMSSTSQVQLLFPVKWSLRCLYFACDSFYIPPGFLPQALGWFSKHLSFLDTSCTPGETNLAQFFRALVHELTCSLREGIQHKLVSCFTKILFLSDNTYHRILSNGMVVSRISF